MKNYLFSMLAFLFAGVTMQAETLACGEPTNVQVQRLSDGSAIINADGGDLFDIFINVPGANTPSATTEPNHGLNDLTFPFTSNILQAQFGYVFWVRTQCSGETSQWVGPFSIDTYDAACNVPSNIVIDRTSDSNATITADAGIYDLFVVAEGNAGPSNVWTGPNVYGDNDVDFSLPYVRTDLAAGVAYDVYFRSQCNVSQVSEWVGPINVPVYQEPLVCNEPMNVTIDRSSDSTATISADDLNANYDLYVVLNGQAGPTATTAPNQHGAENVSFPYTRNDLAAEFGYDVYVRTNCGDETSEWVGPFDLAPYVAPIVCNEPMNVTIDRTSDSSATITADDLNANYDLYVVLNGQAAPTAATAPNQHGAENVSFPYTRNDLASEFGYDVYVRTNCGDETSEWVGPFDLAPYVAPIVCNEPMNVTIDRTSDSSATITADDLSVNYDLYVVLNGQTAPTATTAPNQHGAENVSFPYTRNDLASEFGYDVYVRTNCGDETSEWVGPFDLAEFTPVCEAPNANDISLVRTSTTTAVVDGLDNSFTYQGTANLVGLPLRDEPMYGMDAMTMPHTQYGLVANFEYDVWLRTDCGNGIVSEWTGPLFLGTYANAQPMKLYPNPAVAQVRIEGTEAVSVQVIGMSGKVELSTKVVNNEINLDGLAPGQYIIQATDAQGNVTTSKLMKK